MATEDAFSSASITMVDCDVLEAAKENIQPLATGRRVTSLSSVLATPHAQRESKLAATRHRLRMNVEMALEDEEDDPLEAYWILVNWTLENYPQGHSAESGLLELLEEATRTLKDDRGGKWRGELKYLKLWMLYASFVENPSIIYRFLLANEIGTDIAVLYEEYAAILERDGRRTEADDVYCLGIARKASPLEHLKSRYQDFQKRMMSSALPQIPIASAVPPTSTTRRALITTSTAADIPPAPSVPRTRPHANRPNAPIPIFVDPSGSAARSAELEVNAWPDIGTRKSRIKENVPEKKKMAGTTVKQAGKTKRLASGPTLSKIMPYRDPDPEEMPPPPLPASSVSRIPSTPAKESSFTPSVDDDSKAAIPSTPKFTPFRDETAACIASSAVPDSVMKPKKAVSVVQPQTPSSEAEALRKDPLKNHDRFSQGHSD
ncbi:Mad3/BUB1 homology region 1-domain-containing protein [Lentinula raphanica]|uniref:Mad3/BUB1 homology region 1-domain-containing protein n=1 Tax=Lentinula raphanica TaxID=153919 RepID=A0AA38UG83_9AGAR|nr:Mad3/BUB1 homology region 1-domain-containing protein [Lentinula raphanica]